VVLRAGEAVAYLERSGKSLLTFPAAATTAGWPTALRDLVERRRVRRIEISKIDGVDVSSSPWAAELRANGFVDGYKGLVLAG
jgi:hypothetical protein